jgi:peptidyl-prolyl cis-trans isomerase A (cyclophilin A)
MSLLALGLLALTLAAQLPAQPASREPGLYATMTTTLGTIVLKLFEQESPITVRNFVHLAVGRKAWTDPKTGQQVQRPLYNGLTFHRVIPNFMIQGGDPLGNGTGGTQAIKDEFHPSLKFDVAGRLAMANAGPNTGSCQFFITDVPTPHLNGAHTIFGQVVEGMDVVKKIASTPTGVNDKPRTAVVIQSLTFKREGAAPPNDVLAAPQPKKATPPAK